MTLLHYDVTSTIIPACW